MKGFDATVERLRAVSAPETFGPLANHDPQPWGALSRSFLGI